MLYAKDVDGSGQASTISKNNICQCVQKKQRHHWLSSLELRHNTDPIFCAPARGRIQRKTWCMGPNGGVDYNLTLCEVMSTPESTPTHLPWDWATLCQSRPLNLCQSRLYPPVRDFGFGLCSLLCIEIYTAKCYWSEDYALSLTCRHLWHFTAWDRNKEDRKGSSQSPLSNY